MAIDRTLTYMQRQILNVLAESVEPMTKRDLANKFNVHYQTIANHFPQLIHRNLIKEAYRKGNATYYEIGNESDSLPRISWENKSRTITSLMREIIADQKLPGNQFSRHIVIALSQMYFYSAQAIDDDNPKNIPLAELKRIQTTLARYLDIIDALRQTIKSLIDNDSLWDPRDLPTKLILKDPEMSAEIARSFFESIKDMQK